MKNLGEIGDVGDMTYILKHDNFIVQFNTEAEAKIYIEAMPPNTRYTITEQKLIVRGIVERKARTLFD